jgi:hypothetical protein
MSLIRDLRAEQEGQAGLCEAAGWAGPDMGCPFSPPRNRRGDGSYFSLSLAVCSSPD